MWEDDFTKFDDARWTKVDTNVPTNSSVQDYLPQQVAVEQGKLVITTEDRPSRGLPYRSGQVISKSEQLHGRWEVRAKLPGTQGTWPAIWLLPDTERYRWPSGGEIDIMENRGNQPTLTSAAFHYGANPPLFHQFVFDEQQTSLSGSLVDYHSGFHTYAVEWSERALRFCVDGVHFYTVQDSNVGGFLSKNVKPMQLVINTAVGGHFLPDPDSTSGWPQRFEIDWVRVYEPDPETAVHEFRNGGFEDNGGSLSDWSTFGDSLCDSPNVLAADEATLEGDAALKIFGAFSNGEEHSGVSQGITVSPGQLVTASLSALVRSANSILGTSNVASMRIEFYSDFGGDQMLGVKEVVIANGATTNDAWVAHSLTAAAPPGAAEARLAIVFHQPAVEPGAVHVDRVEFEAAEPAAAVDDFSADDAPGGGNLGADAPFGPPAAAPIVNLRLSGRLIAASCQRTRLAQFLCCAPAASLPSNANRDAPALR